MKRASQLMKTVKPALETVTTKLNFKYSNQLLALASFSALLFLNALFLRFCLTFALWQYCRISAL